MTYNIRHGDKGVQAIWAAVAGQKADIVCLQEASAQGKWPDPAAGLLRSIPRDWHTVHGDELLIASRYPIESSTLHRPEGTGEFAMLEAIVNANGRRLTVYTTHLSAITPFGLLTCWRNHAQLQYVQQTMRWRSLQTDWIIAQMRNTTGPVVLAGDFNTPPRGLLYQRLVSQMQDSFRAAGWGLGLTFRTNLPLWRIDYVFTDRKTSVTRCRVPGVAASNHMPVVADLVAWRQTSEGRSSASK
jgi:vancomycin resistance protein VanJ